MFNNSEKVLDIPLKNVDLFHLTWYWFQQNYLLAATVGILQIIGSLLLLTKRYVLFGVIILWPIMINIFLIDLYCTNMPALTTRVLYYNILVAAVCYNRKSVILEIINSMRLAFINSDTKKSYSESIVQIFLGLVLFGLLELVIIIITNLFSSKFF